MQPGLLRLPWRQQVSQKEGELVGGGRYAREAKWDVTAGASDRFGFRHVGEFVIIVPICNKHLVHHHLES